MLRSPDDARAVDDTATDDRLLDDTATDGRVFDGDSADVLWNARVHLWLLAVLFFAVGDLTTTSVGLGYTGVVEAGPVVAPLVARHGVAAMVGLKGATFACCYILYRAVPRPHSVGVPLGLATLGVLVTGWNLSVLAVAIAP